MGNKNMKCFYHLMFFLCFSLLVGCEGSVEPNDSKLAKEAGAPIFEGLGNHSHLITTGHEGAQRYFNQGLILAFGFNHAESIRSFRAAQKLDPTCGMCFWGEALATGPNINVTSSGKAVMSADQRVGAFAAIQKAQDNSGHLTQNERDYIDALSQRYNGEPSTPRAPLDTSYAVAMEALKNKYPEDNDAASLFSEALMNTMPWNYWTDEGTPKPDTKKVLATLESVLSINPDHPLAIHLYIHAVEASKTPERAEPYADRLGKLVPGSGHLVHMPSHIFWRVGRYNDASQANIDAAQVDEEYIAQCNAQGFYPAAYYPHNIHFLWASAAMEGRSALSIESGIKVSNYVRIEMIKKFPMLEYFRTLPLLSMVRFSKWEDVLDFPEDIAEFKYSKGIRHYARGTALAAKGNIDSAKKELVEIAPLIESEEVSKIVKASNPAKTLLGIAQFLLQGAIHEAEENYDLASKSYQNAVNYQDTLPYMEPPFWYYPTRQSLARSLMLEKKFGLAEQTYRDDLKFYPRNGWSMFGLVASLEAQSKTDEAEIIERKAKDIWQLADVELMPVIY
jgi:tetratricopeptide (TPR) repeat protein|tara:strand:- start:519 stop:2207 length:1689 start_codon:yes stop_codon:yes gene_type:complete